MLENVTPNSPGLKRSQWPKDTSEPTKQAVRREECTLHASEQGIDVLDAIPNEWDAGMQQAFKSMQSLLERRLLQVLDARLPPEDEFTKLTARVAILEKQVFDRSQSGDGTDIDGTSAALQSGRTCSREDDDSSVDTRFVDHDCDPLATPRSAHREAGTAGVGAIPVMSCGEGSAALGAQEGVIGAAGDLLNNTVRCAAPPPVHVAEDSQDALDAAVIPGADDCAGHSPDSAVDDTDNVALDEEYHQQSMQASMEQVQTDPRRRCWNTPALPPENPPPLPCDLVKGLRRQRGAPWPQLPFQQPPTGAAAASGRGRAQRGEREREEAEGTRGSEDAQGRAALASEPAAILCAPTRASSHPPQKAPPLGSAVGLRAQLHFQALGQGQLAAGSKLIVPSGRVRCIQAERATLGAPVMSPRCARVTTPSPPPAALRGRGGGRVSAPLLLHQQGQHAQLPPTGLHGAPRVRSPPAHGRRSGGHSLADVVYVPSAGGWSVTLPHAVAATGGAVARRRSNSTLGGQAGDGDC